MTTRFDPARGWSQGIEFPHPNTGGRFKPGKEYYESLANSPFGNELLLEFAKRCVVAEQLGADDVPDLLVVSFSSNDLIGHTWGPDSQEVLDVTLRSDALMADLLSFLDRQVGKDQYLLAVTADHGICPLPEVSRSKGLDAKRIDPKVIQKDIEDHLTAKFGAPAGPMVGEKKPAWVEAQVFPWIYLNPKVCTAAKRSRSDVAAAVAEFLSRRPEFARAIPRAELDGVASPEDRIGAAGQALLPPGPRGRCLPGAQALLPSIVGPWNRHHTRLALRVRSARSTARDRPWCCARFQVRAHHPAGRGRDLCPLARRPPAEVRRIPRAGIP